VCQTDKAETIRAAAPAVPEGARSDVFCRLSCHPLRANFASHAHIGSNQWPAVVADRLDQFGLSHGGCEGAFAQMTLGA
jgi:hypothetical protein